MMTIKDLRSCLVVPFDISDPKLHELFSFFLHKAPGINSKSATAMAPLLQKDRWVSYIDSWQEKTHRIYAEDYKLDDAVSPYGLNDDCVLKRDHHRFVCKREKKTEPDSQCVLRHLRNAIAHGNVYVSKTGKRKFILFEDFNKPGNRTGLFLFSQTDLMQLKKAFTN